MRTDVLIIGGGLAGLACAWALRESGLRVTLLEASDRLGGRAGSCRDEVMGDQIDLGPHILLSEYHNMLHFLSALGTREHVVWNGRHFITLVDHGRPLAINMARLPPPLHMLPSMLHAPVSLHDSNSNARTTFFAMKMSDADVLRLDEMKASDFLRSMGVSRRFIDWFWSSAAMTILNLPLDRCSAGALLRFYRILLSHNDLAMGMPGVALADLFAPPAARAITRAGGDIRLRSTVTALTCGDGAVTDVGLADGTRLSARFIVSAVPPQSLRALLPQEVIARHPVFAQLDAFEPDPYISTYLWFDRKLTHQRNWSRVWSPTTLNYDSYDLANIRPGWAGRNSVIASNIIYSHRAQGLSDEAIIEHTVREIADYLPAATRAGVMHARVHRIPLAIPCPLPGTERRRPHTLSPLRGLLLAGDWIQTRLPACMESAVRSGWLAAEHIFADIGQPRRLVAAFSEPEGLTGWVARWSGATGARGAAAAV